MNRMPQTKCLCCKQVFDDRKQLFCHLQQNPSHKRGKSKSHTKVFRSRLPAHAQTQSKTGDCAPATVGKASPHAANVGPRSGDGLSWLSINEEQDAYLREIVPSRCHPSETLTINQYHLENRTRAQLEQLQACINCNRKRPNPNHAPQPCVFHADRPKAKGKRNIRARTCCTSQSRGCQTLPEHVYPPVIYDDFKTSPGKLTALGNAPLATKRLAVVVDCEMVAVAGGSSELAQLCAVDLVTAEVLVNSLIQPNGRVIDWRTRHSGMTRDRMALAVRNGQALPGWQAARAELWKHVDGDTILVGHALQHDLKALHLIHHRVVDTSILTRLAVGPDCRRSWSLKALCAELANLVIQDHGRKGHDCLEDTLATREVFLRCILGPEALERWAVQKRMEEQVKALARDMAKSMRVGNVIAPDIYRTVSEDEDDGDEGYCHDSEVLHWSDIAEDLGWPHPDTGYDPWSD